ncbi:pyruvate dehydrogenase complex dihydrolipoamide acetyltransferase [Kordiimonas sp. SCSIO 12610]|uniref:pyruvate dehydrogenase complex dihydrolipoamide acetyltransferase n=1 Tax=Kordiimonas sp. SCSIO 12610 TaxID=2829597 RepID=UPI00220E7B46|nr:pyruvate dehydrogenase complex dihydrolipoamide acetyltransferase [Kordiimonas sp. SCSIO 12610]UTW54024.1 pyruvate dehydrogenase complex dihydrolipoamide acetyltransferase [Kordiimonas sp. SCSIO 12610]
MAVEIFMPALSPTMEAGTLAKWLVKEGDSVESGDVIAEIETDKATMEVEAIDEGTIAKIFIAEGTEDVKVGEIIAVLAEDGEDVADVAAGAPAASAAPVPAPAPKTETATSTPAPATQAAPQSVPVAPATPTAAPSGDGNRVKASPLAKRIALNEGLDIAAVAGSGPNGRIVKRDVEAAIASGGVAASASPAPASAPTQAASAPAPTASEYGPHDDIPYREEKLSGMRKTIARRLTESKTTVPHFYLTIECELDNLLKQRKELNAKLADSGVKLSVNDFIIRASALALKKVPAANVQYAGDKMYWYERADISVAVAVEGGLVTPVVRGADAKGLAQISSDVKELAGKAKDGKLMPEDYAGGTFSISNLGMFGIKEFSAVINPPQGAILAVGAGEQRAVVKDGALAVATVMSCTLSCDHRAIDGAVGAEFLAAFKGYIEDPLTMLL